MTDAEIVDGYKSGVVNDDTFCWKDGMNDWLPLRDIEPLREICGLGESAGAGDALGGLFAPGPQAASTSSRPPASNGNGAGPMLSPPVAARRVARATGDLFGSAAQAGGEDDVMTSAPVGVPQVHDDQKLTGARNENSVLFSLNAMTSKGGPGGDRPMTASAEASGLIDIRQLSAQIGIGDDKKKSRIDDIMNLAGGGAFSPSLSGPVLTAPAVEEYAPQPDARARAVRFLPPATKSRALIVGALFAGTLVVVGGIGAAVMLTRDKPAETDKGASAASASVALVATSAAPAPTDTVAATASTPAAASGPSDTSSVASASSGTTATAAAGTKDSSKPAPTTTKPTTTATATTAPAATPAAAAAGADQPSFNMGEAKARLAATAGSVQACKKGDVSGSGRVVVMFAPNGAAQSATISGPPFEGTPTGACVAARFRGVRVPAFSGSPFSVSKSFTIN